jgi:hypothetical protein
LQQHVSAVKSHLQAEYKVENNHYHDYETLKPKQISPTNPHKQKKNNKKTKKQTIIKTTPTKINSKIKNQHNKFQSQQSN